MDAAWWSLRAVVLHAWSFSFLVALIGVAQQDASARAQQAVANENVCTIVIEENGATAATITFEPGEDYGEYVTTRCGPASDYPCYCSLDIDSKKACPYCGFVTSEGTFYCARDGETISFEDGSLTRQCTCQIPEDFPTSDPIRTCTVVTEDDGSDGVDTVDDQDDDAIVSPTLPPGVTISILQESESCVYKYPDGTEFIFFDGESFATLVDGPCGSGSNWPAFCSASGDNGGSDGENSGTLLFRQGGSAENIFVQDPHIRYPYCIYRDSSDTGVLCGKDSEETAYMNSNGSSVVCTCSVDADTGEPVSVCDEPSTDDGEFVVNDSCTYTYSDGFELSFFIGESFGSLVEGPCK